MDTSKFKKAIVVEGQKGHFGLVWGETLLFDLTDDLNHIEELRKLADQLNIAYKVKDKNISEQYFLFWRCKCGALCQTLQPKETPLTIRRCSVCNRIYDWQEVENPDERTSATAFPAISHLEEKRATTWISVKDGLPAINESVLVEFNFQVIGELMNHYASAYLNPKHEWIIDGYGRQDKEVVIRWTKLPELPKE